MAWGTIDIVTLLAPQENFRRNREGKGIDQFPSDLASIELLINPTMANRHRPWDKRASHPIISKEGTGRKGLLLWLVEHKLPKPTARQQKQT
jgi:hypothetical protein